MIRLALLALATTGMLVAFLAIVVFVGMVRLSNAPASAMAISGEADPPTTPPPKDASPPSVAAPAAIAPPPVQSAEESEDDHGVPASLYLDADHATLQGKAKILPKKNDKPAPPAPAAGNAKAQKHPKPPPANWIGGWRESADAAVWTPVIPAAGKYEIDLIYATPDGAGGTFEIAIGDQKLTGKTDPTKNGQRFRISTLATVSLPAGPLNLTVRPRDTAAKKPLMNLKAIKLIPADE